MKEIEEIVKALVNQQPIKQTWWFDNDYFKFDNKRLKRFSEGLEPLDCTEDIYCILSSIVNNTDKWMVGTKEVKSEKNEKSSG